MTVVGLIFIALSLFGQIYISLAPQIAANWVFTDLPWWNYIIIGIAGAAFLLQIWGWVVHAEATQESTDATTFRSWRVNYVTVTVGATVAVASSVYFLTIYLLGMNGTVSS